MIKVISHNQIREGDISTMGGKAYNLWKLSTFGINVPAWVYIPVPQIFNSNDIPSIAKKIHSYSFSKKELDIFSNLLDDTKRYAVRSSGIQEDGSNFSFAGQFESFLNVTIDEIPEAIKKVWLSGISDRVQTYRKINQIEGAYGVSVIVQEMVDATASGVGFGINPANGDTHSKLITAVFGLGEGLVSGQISADSYFIQGDKIEKSIAKKERAYQYDVQSKQNTYIKLPVSKSEQSSLTDAQLAKLISVLDKLTEAYGAPQDIEFAFKENQFYCLQSRPISAISANQNKSEQDRIVWDNSNIIESYPGITSPMTFSFIRKMYNAVYRQMSQLMGVKKQVIEENDLVYKNMLGLLRGRVYYNLRSWYQALAVFPGYKVNARYMEKMMGVKERFDLSKHDNKTKFSSYWQLFSALLSMIWQLLTLPRKRQRFQSFAETVFTKYGEIEYDKISPTQSRKIYFELEEILLKKWNEPLINDFFAMIYFGLLSSLCQKWMKNEPGLENKLLASSNDIISSQPVAWINTINQLIIANPRFHTVFKTQEPQNIVKFLEQEKHSEISKEIFCYLEKFGDRCTGELKLETVTYRDDPARFINILKSQVSSEVHFPKRATNADSTRTMAEKIIRNTLRFKPFKNLLFRHVLRRARDLVSSRENLRFERTRAFALVRQIINGIGIQFHKEKLIQDPRDIYFLKMEEVFDFIAGNSIEFELNSLIAIRRSAYNTYKQETPLPERIETFGNVYPSIKSQLFSFTAATQKKLTKLEGLGCCAGIVESEVVVVSDPQSCRSVKGKIMVASHTDPGWVTLFPTASGILVERGSLLSHSAIVSRELGIPCVVRIDKLMHTLKTGDRVRMDGSTGEVYILDK